MWTTLALVAALQLAPNQGGPTLANDRLTHGYFGAARKDASYLPGDAVFLAFDASNLKLNEAGKASCAVALELTDSTGKTFFKQAPRQQLAQVSLGGNTLHSVAALQIPPEQPPGDYTVKLTFQDAAAGVAKSLERKIKVLPAGFGLVHINTAADPEGKVSKAPAGAVGEPLYVNFAVVGYGRDATKKQPNVEVSLRILDGTGKPVATQPMKGVVSGDIPADLKVIPMQFGLTLNRAGNFTLELTATDKIGGGTSSVVFPLKVISLE